MKNLFKVFVVLLIPFVFYLITGFFSSLEEKSERKISEKKTFQTPVATKDFLNIIQNFHYSSAVEQQWVSNQLTNIKSLNYNALHIYGGFNQWDLNNLTYMGSYRYGYFGIPLSTAQIDSTNALMDRVGNFGLKGIFGRVKIEALCYGQRIIYEAEGGNYGFSYVDRINDPEPDGDRWVVKASTNGGTYGILCDNITENLQHSDIIDYNFNSLGVWYLKPVLKIKQSDFDPNDPTEVVRIEVNSFTENDIIATKIIRVRNFKDGINPYGGDYISQFDFSDEPFGTNLKIKGKDSVDGLNHGRNLFNAYTYKNNCHVNFRIIWCGNVDVWFDKLIVDDTVGNVLFNPIPTQNYDTNIQQEVSNFTNNPSNVSFHADEIKYSNYECIKYVMNKMKGYNPNSKLAVVTNPYSNYIGLRDTTQEHKLFFQKVNPEITLSDAYEVYAGCIPNNVTITDNKVPSSWKKPYSEYTEWLQEKVFGDKDKKHNTIDKYGSYIYNVSTLKQQSLLTNPPPQVIMVPQLHSYVLAINDEYIDNDPFFHYRYGNREPLNEEIQAQAMLAIAHGIDGLCWFIYTSGHWQETMNGTEYTRYMQGLLNENLSHREINWYNQNKWDSVKKLNEKIMNWKPTLDNVNWVEGYSVHTEGADHNYINDIKSIHRNPQLEFLYDAPCSNCDNVKYWEMGFFEPISSTDKSKYLLMVNRRCVPEVSGGDGDLRSLYIKFNPTALTISNNWTIKDINTRESITFDKNSNAFTYLASLGLFQPGEGKLFKLSPVSQSGGTLVCDENIQSGTINCEDTVFTNGHNLTIGFGTTINFSDSGCIVVNGGRFTCGDVSQPNHTRDITFKGVTNNNWNGFTFNGCDLVNINSAQFQNVKGPAENTNYAVKMINCNTFNINNCTFTNADPQKSGAIEANYSGSSSGETNINIAGNTFNMNSSDKTIVSIIANAECSVPVMLDNNIFTSTSNSATAMYLSFINGVEISGNAIVGYNKGIEMHYSNIDVIGNSITSTTGNNGAKGIDADLSTANLSVNGTLRTGGLNIFDNAGQNINNIYVNDSYFYLDKGKNIFSIISNSNSYHLKGYFPGDTPGNPIDETANCFKVDNVAVVESNLPVKDVKWRDSENDIDFGFFSYDCSTGSECDEMIVDMGNSVYDTICIIPGGSGGGVPSIQTITPKKMYDSLCILMRLRNFPQAKIKCYQLLNTFPDSTQSLNAISKLYYLAVSLDTSTVNITDCKTFLNTLILNHPNNLPLVRKCNYYVQKCKVRLKQYQSAMTGFQQIMQQNPYSYEALLASWDYAATHLLDSLNTSGGISNVQLPIYNVQFEEQEVENSLLAIDFSDVSLFTFDVLFEKMDKFLFNDDDKDAFTKEQRKSISTSVVTALDNSKKQTKNHIETLTKKSEAGNTDAKVELKVIKTLKEVVKIKRPKTIYEHIKSVNKDIQKLNTVKNETVKNVTNIVPETYNLSQNYPNPFNPVTKINYELPKDGKVKLVIYDILGREIKTLVNELKQAGRYTIEFNGTQYASGVYFYRIQVEGQGSAVAEGKTYTSVKKMVLIK